MSSKENQRDFVKTVWGKIRTQLEDEKARRYTEIGNYPTPIAGCDQQFNHLLQEHREVLRELARLTKAEAESLTADDPNQVVETFIQSSSYINSEVY